MLPFLHFTAADGAAEVAEGAAEAVNTGVEATTDAIQNASHLIIPKFLQGYVDNAISLAISIIVVLIIARLVLTLATHTLNTLKLEATLRKFVRSIVKVVIIFLSVLVIAGKLGFDTSSVVALASVLSAAFALAAQGALSNLFGGVLLLLTKPFFVGDFVSAGDVMGTVLEIGLLHTLINSPDNKRVSVPNGSIASSTITNFSTEGKRRVDLNVTASYDAPVELTKKAIFEAIEATDGIVQEPAAPFVRVFNYGESSIEYVIRVWAPTAAYWDVYFDLMENIKVYFDKNGVEMTYNHMNVHMMKD